MGKSNKRKSRKGKGIGTIITLLAMIIIAASLAYSQEEQAQAEPEVIVSITDALDALNQAQQAITSLEGSGIFTSRIEDMAADANLLFEQGDYAGSQDASLEAVSLKDTAIELQDRLSDTKELAILLTSVGHAVDGFNATYTAATTTFSTANYERTAAVLDPLELSLYALLSEENRLLQAQLAAREDEADERSIKLRGMRPFQEQLQTIQDIQDTQGLKDAGSYKGFAELHAAIITYNRSAARVISLYDLQEESESLNTSSTYFNDLFDEAHLALELEKHDRVAALAEEGVAVRQEAERAVSALRQAETRLEDAKDAGRSHPEADELLSSARLAFSIGDFSTARSAAAEAQTAIEAAATESLITQALSKSNAPSELADFFRTYWWMLVVGAGVLVVIGFISYEAARPFITRKRIQKLRREQDSIITLIKQVQRTYFSQHKMSKEDYESSYDRFNERQIKVRERIELLNNQLKQQKSD